LQDTTTFISKISTSLRVFGKTYMETGKGQGAGSKNEVVYYARL
jgi:hypothetical protein